MTSVVPSNGRSCIYHSHRRRHKGVQSHAAHPPPAVPPSLTGVTLFPSPNAQTTPVYFISLYKTGLTRFL